MNKIQNFVKSKMKTYSKTKTYSKEEFEKMVSGMQSRRSELGSSEAWLTCYEWAMVHKDEAKSLTKDALISTLQKECGVPEFVAKDCTNDIKDYVNSYSKSECPVCHSTPCTCSAIATHSDEILNKVKADLTVMADALGFDKDELDSIKSNIQSATKEDIIKMLDEEIGNAKDDDADEVKSAISKFKDFRSQLGTNCGDQKTYSAMANLDLEFKGDLDALLKKYEPSVNNLPKIGDNDTAEEFLEEVHQVGR